MGFSKPFYGGWAKTVGQMKLDGFIKSQVRLIIRYSLFANFLFRIFKSLFMSQNVNKLNKKKLKYFTRQSRKKF